MPRSARRAFLAVLAALSAACSLRDAACGPPARTTAAAQAAQAATASGGDPRASGSGSFKIVFLGDSLTAGLGLLSEDAYPSIIQRKFADEGYANVDIVNAGVSGDTTAGGAARLPDLLEPDVKIVVIALGGNDALRGLTAAQTRENLAKAIEAAQANGSMVFLAGMEAPTNLGEDYRLAFHAVFLQLARDYRSRLNFMPFLLDGVAGNPALNQADGIHPNKDGARIVAENMYPKLRMMVDALGGG